MNEQALPSRQRLLEQIAQLARQAIHGTLSETYRTCGNPRCRCHTQGPKHGPHLYISYRGEGGKTSGYYVPKAAQNEVRRGVEAWSQLQTQLRQLSALNKERNVNGLGLRRPVDRVRSNDEHNEPAIPTKPAGVLRMNGG